MNTNEVNLLNGIKRSKFSVQINLTVVGMVLFTFYFSTLKSFLFSLQLGVITLVFSIFLLLFDRLLFSNTGIKITKIDFLWILFLMFFIIHVGFSGLIRAVTIVDIIVYSSGILFLLLVKMDINAYEYPLKIIKVIGIIFACSTIFQYLYTDIYFSHILPLFQPNDQAAIINNFNGGGYAGFTNQTAHLAGYIVSGLGVLVFYRKKRKNLHNVSLILYLIILFTGLLLSAKRAHLIFGVISLIFTGIISTSKKKAGNKILLLITSILLILALSSILLNAINLNNYSESPIVNFLMEIEYTIKGVIEGEDVSSGRLTLYGHSWDLFNDNIMFGIGWREFIENSIGLIYPITSNRGSHPHNIYLQMLTEMGITGFVFFIVPILYLYYKTYRLLRLLSVKNGMDKWKNGIKFSFFSQTFFLLYGLTGNLLTDYNFLLTYFFACSISLSALVSLKQFTKTNT